MTSSVSRVLIVDDDMSALFIMTSILRKAGISVDCATTVADALTVVRVGSPDLILLDITLPDGNGVDFCRRIKNEAFCSQTPVLFISSSTDVETKLAGFEAGGADYINKPFAAAEVLARVRTHLRMKAAYESLAKMQADRVAHLASITKTILPRSEDFPDAKFALSMLSHNEAGGDFCDVIKISDHIVDYVVADASGHDLAASFWTAALKALLLEYARAVNSPIEILQNLNNALCQIMPSGAFFTMIYARINRNGGQVILANAGHPPAISLTCAGPAKILDQCGDILGAFPEAMFGLQQFNLKPGDKLFLYSDGLVELDGPRETGIQALAQSCVEYRDFILPAMVDAVVHSVRAGSVLADDIVLMGVEM